MMRINGTGGEKRAELWKEFVVRATTWRAYTFGDGLLYAMIRSGRTPSWLRADWIQWSRCTLIYVMHYEKETMPSGASLVYDSLPGRHEKKNYRVVRCPCRYRFSNVKSREFPPFAASSPSLLFPRGNAYICFSRAEKEREEGERFKCILEERRVGATTTHRWLDFSGDCFFPVFIVSSFFPFHALQRFRNLV